MSQTVLITGASGGIGGEMIKQFADAGYNVVAHYFTKEKETIRKANWINAKGGMYRFNQVIAVYADLRDRASVQAMFDVAVGNFGQVEVLVNNAGIAQQKLFTDITAEDWKQMFAVNVDGVFHCCQCALPDMIRRKYGKIINVSSMWGQVGASCEVHYSAAKAAVIGLTKALAKEVGPSGIEVNCIAPGVIDTPMNRNLNEETMRELKEETPLNMIGKPKDVANLALFLAEKKTRFITGQVLGINGGMVI